MSLIAILTDPGKGGTFLTWSLHYLAGHTHYFNAELNSWLDLPENPLTNRNAHNFKANQIGTYSHVISTLTNLSNCKAFDFHTVYLHNLQEIPYSKESVDTKKAIGDIMLHTDKLVVVTNQPKNSLYDKCFSMRASPKSIVDPTIQNLSDEDHLHDIINYFFKDDIAKWKELQLTNKWDLREFLALNFRYDELSIAPCIDLSIKHHAVDAMELFNLGDLLMPQLFESLNIQIARKRLKLWTTVYQSWRKIHYNRLNFLWYFDNIINYIVNGYYMDLQRFNLDIIQEAFIQHELIYKYNLNLKTFQPEKFTSTQQLHSLLEPNIHPLVI